jgi:O-antigen/teichoic acid export membrane protein
MVGLRIAQQILGLTRLVILARLLSPRDFGVMGIAILTMGAIETLTLTGFETALVQRKERAETFLNSAWTVNIIRGVLLFIGLLLLAPYAARFFRTPQAAMLIRAIGLSLLLRGFLNIGTVYFQKELEFNKQFALQFSMRLADFIVAVPLAIILKNAWALVIAFVAGDLVRIVVSYTIHPYRPRFDLNIGKAKELFEFGKWILGYYAIIFLLDQGAKAFIGRFINATMLGYYQIASRISNMPATEFAIVISQVTIPTYSKLQDNAAKLREGYLRVFQLTAFFTIALAGAVLILAPSLTRVFLGDKWLPAVAAMQMLAAWGAVRSVMVTADPVFVAVGRPRTITKYQSIQLCMLAVLIYPLSARWGIVGTAAAVTLAGFAAGIPLMNRVLKITGCVRRDLIRLIVFPLAMTLLAVTAVLALRRLGLIPDRPVVEFILSAVIYGGVYLAATHLIGRPLDYRVMTLLREIRDGLRAK